jgi:AhpD family alkylhydroperoxidase
MARTPLSQGAPGGLAFAAAGGEVYAVRRIAMANYYDSDSIKKLRRLRQLKPETFKAFVDFDAKAFEEGAIDVKNKELIAVGVAHVTQCPFCIDAHTQRAMKAGASETEIAEAVFIAMAMRAGGAWAHSCIALAAAGEGRSSAR